jgi:hypothetical protein
MVNVERHPTKTETFEPTPTHPGLDALDYQTSLQLGDAGDKGDEDPSHSTRRVNIFSGGNKLNL